MKGFFNWRSVCGLLLSTGVFFGLQGSAYSQSAEAAAKKIRAEPFTTQNERCIVPASTYHSVNPHVLRAILRVESGLRPDAVGQNSNGTIDVGIGQMNSMHFKELRMYGITPAHLKDACIGTYVAAWHLRKNMARGNTWQAIASYHSSTPYFNERYQALLRNELRKAGAMGGGMEYVAPIKRASAQSNQRQQGAAPREGGGESSTVVAFDHSSRVSMTGEMQRSAR